MEKQRKNLLMTVNSIMIGAVFTTFALVMSLLVPGNPEFVPNQWEDDYSRRKSI
ncbi:MAG: hypothetical protein ACFFC7_33660 [Candidatus Hermodarchaeota archaeon]